MKLGHTLRLGWRESRGSRARLIFFVVCLSVGVAAVVAVAGLAAAMEEGVRTESRRLLAADVVARANRPLPEELETFLEGHPAVNRTDVWELVTMASAPERRSSKEGQGTSRLVELKAVDGRFPYYGELVLEPALPLEELLTDETVVVAPELAQQLGLGAGDPLRIGGQEFAIAGVVAAEPDRLSISFSLGPRVFLTKGGLDRTSLLEFGSRVRYRTLLELPAASSKGAVAAFADELRQEIGAGRFVRIETYADAQPDLRRSIGRVEVFLGLVALLSLLIGGIGVAQTVRAWLASRMPAIAVLKSLGLRPREVLWLYAGQTVALGFVGSALGAAIGTGVVALVPLVAQDLIPTDGLRVWQPEAVGRGLLLGMGVALFFSLAPLLTVLRVPPLAVLRRDAEPIPPSRWVRFGSAAVLFLGVFATAWVQSARFLLGLQFAAGLFALVLLLAAGTRALTWTVARLPRERARVWMRHGLAACARPGPATLGAIVALGLGVLVVLGMFVVQRELARALLGALPEDAPTAFLIDIQPDQWSGVSGVLADAGAESIDSTPVVMARLRSVEGVPVQELLAERQSRGRERWILTREQRLTYMDGFGEDNAIVEGAPFSDAVANEVSIEEEFAANLGVGVGSEIVMEVEGVPFTFAVTSLRRVEWETFRINFFLVVEPGVLEEAPQARIAAVRLPVETELDAQDRLAALFPNVTLIRIRPILELLVGVLERVGLGVQLLGGFTVVAGIAILFGAVSAGAVQRGREVALLKTLGMTRAGVLAVFGLEFLLIGALAGAIGAAGAAVLGHQVLTRGMELDFRFQPAIYLGATLATAGLAVTAGLLSSARALERKPLESLRAE